MLKLLVFFVCFNFSYLLADEVKFEVKPLMKWDSNFDVVRLNDSGLIAGTVVDHGLWRAFTYNIEKKEFKLLPSFDGYTFVSDINNLGSIIGFAEIEMYNTSQGKFSEWHPCIWKDSEEPTDLTTKLNSCYAGEGSDYQLHINDNGLIGSHAKQSKNNIFYDTVKGKIQNIPYYIGGLVPYNFSNYLVLRSINNKNNAIFCLFNGFNYNIGTCIKSYFWDAKINQMKEIKNLENHEKYYCMATSLNDFDQIIGTSEVNNKFNGYYSYHAFLWDKNETIDLGTLEDNENSEAIAINNLTEIIGYSGYSCKTKPFFWKRETGMLDLNSLIDKLDEWVIKKVFYINNLGQIVAIATNQNDTKYLVILNPK